MKLTKQRIDASAWEVGAPTKDRSHSESAFQITHVLQSLLGPAMVTAGLNTSSLQSPSNGSARLPDNRLLLSTGKSVWLAQGAEAP
ncbi:MAG: hypothetical protein PVI91_04465 [Gammaproteobacteria bacterium]|jgi:hypothetical protein